MAANQLGFTCQDFLPNCVDRGGIFTTSIYEPFSTLIVRANKWLCENRKWKVVTCESVEFKYEGDDMNFNKMSYLEHGGLNTRYLRGLRLWLRELENGLDRQQQIGYMNLIPQELQHQGFLRTPSYETLDEVITKFNSTVRINPLPGKVITVETQEMKIKPLSEFDPDCSYWAEKGDIATRFIFVIRIFYEIEEGNPEEIGLKDFVPDKLESGGLFSTPKYESFSNLVEKISHWHSLHNDIRICNVQSVEIKKKSGKPIDTQRMEYIEHGNVRTAYVRILRVAYLKSSYLYPDTTALLTGRFGCMTFVPEKIERNLFSAKYEDLAVMKEKVSAWIKATGTHVVSAETAALRLYTGGEARYGTEATYTFNRSNRHEFWIFVIRLYLYTG